MSISLSILLFSRVASIQQDKWISHFAGGKLCLGWVHPGEASIENPQANDISQQVEMWLEQENWPDANDFVGDTRQLWGNGLAMNPVRKSMVALAEERLQ